MDLAYTLMRGTFQRRQIHQYTFVNIPESTVFRTLSGLLPEDATSFPGLSVLPIGAVSSVLFLITVLVAIGTVLYKERETSIESRQVAFFFWLELAYMALLIALGGVYMTCWPPNDDPVNLIGGIVPFAVPWFGALGAVLIGLEAVFMHNKNWDSRFNYWHIARPIMGAVLGFVAFFVMVLLIKSSGANPAFLTPKDPNFSSTDLILYYVLAFLVGYREETFRELIKRASDLILTSSPPASSAPPTPQLTFLINGRAETNGDFGGTAVNSASRRQIVVQNSGTTDLEDAEATITNESPGTDIFKLVTNPLNLTASWDAMSSGRGVMHVCREFVEPNRTGRCATGSTVRHSLRDRRPCGTESQIAKHRRPLAWLFRIAVFLSDEREVPWIVSVG